ncbi:MAG: 4-hydroxy-tetrahydrodipicolinate reductase [Candidatus Krumholzibacteriota bacterium]|nr:4-hydroxy-tetrahydrodipicolinate reductase [Candidatus Krumholzibacteriota bacterium]
MIKIVITGAGGRMGGIVAEEIAREEGLELVGAVVAPRHAAVGSVFHGINIVSDLREVLSPADVIVDFTSPEASLRFIAACAQAGRAMVIGTTGFSAPQIETIRGFSEKIPVLLSPNMSAGTNLLFKLVEEVTRALEGFDIEIMEIHHNRKKDSPSGTASRLAEAVQKVRPGTTLIPGREGSIGPRPKEEIGIFSLRGGDVVGEHTVIFAGEGERLELTHRAHSRLTFARGTLRAISFIHGRAPGLYSMTDVLGL